jgi:hypothetical protein
MKTILIIKPHSVIDVITNSSSELFACEKGKTIEVVEEFLKSKKIKGCQKPWIFNLKDYREWRIRQQYAVEKDWENPFYVIEGWFFDPQNEDDVREQRENHIGKYDSPWHDRLWRANSTAKGWDARQAEMKKIYEEIEYSESKPDWWFKPDGDYNSTSVEEIDGCVIILSEDDNSISSKHMDLLEGMFNATRLHLG